MSSPDAESKPAFSFNNRVVGTVKFDSGSTTMPAAGNSTVETVAKTLGTVAKSYMADPQRFMDAQMRLMAGYSF